MLARGDDIRRAKERIARFNSQTPYRIYDEYGGEHFLGYSELFFGSKMCNLGNADIIIHNNGVIESAARGLFRGILILERQKRFSDAIPGGYTFSFWYDDDGVPREKCTQHRDFFPITGENLLTNYEPLRSCYKASDSVSPNNPKRFTYVRAPSLISKEKDHHAIIMSPIDKDLDFAQLRSAYFRGYGIQPGKQWNVEGGASVELVQEIADAGWWYQEPHFDAEDKLGFRRDPEVRPYYDRFKDSATPEKIVELIEAYAA